MGTNGNTHAEAPSILAAHGIETKLELPGVGENLQDQTNVALFYPGRRNESGFAPYAVFANVHDLYGEGATASLAASTKAKLPDWARAVADANGGAVGAQAIERFFAIQHDLIFARNATVAEALSQVRGDVLQTTAFTQLPFSRGSVHLAPGSGAVADQPLIDQKWFTVDFDLSVQLTMSRVVTSLWNVEPSNSLLGPGDLPIPFDATDSEWEAYIAENGKPDRRYYVFKVNDRPLSDLQLPPYGYRGDDVARARRGAGPDVDGLRHR